MKKIIITILLASAIWTAHRTELCIGRVLNDQGDGKLYNGESFYNYICYPERFSQDDIILTVDLLNPTNNYCDDVVFRYDIRLLKNA